MRNLEVRQAAEQVSEPRAIRALKTSAIVRTGGPGGAKTMKENQLQPGPRIQQAASELQELIRSHYPHAAFALSRGEDPDGYYLQTVVDLDDPDEVMDLVVDRLLELQIDERIPLHVLPPRTPERRHNLIRAQAGTRPWNRDRSLLRL